jgi:hypothetical protein
LPQRAKDHKSQAAGSRYKMRNKTGRIVCDVSARVKKKFITLAEEIYLEPCKRMQFSKVGRIPPTEVGGYFKSNLQQKLQAALNPSDGSRRIFQIQPTAKASGCIKSLRRESEDISNPTYSKSFRLH